MSPRKHQQRQRQRQPQQRNGGAQLAKMMLRRLSETLEHDDDNAEALEMPLNALIRASKSAGVSIRDEKGFPKLVKVIQKYKNIRPDTTQKAMVILCYSFESLDDEGMTSAIEMDQRRIIVQELIAIVNIHLKNHHGVIRSTVVFMARLASDIVDLEVHVIEGFLVVCFREGMLTAIASAMQQYIHDVDICSAGVYLIQQFMCADDDDIQQAICKNTLNIAIEAAVCDYPGKLQRKDADDLEKFLEESPDLVTAMDQDPIWGPLRQAYRLHKDTNETIRKYGREMQYAAIERQKHRAKFFSCMNSSCEKRLSKKQRLICTRCRSTIYCSKECQAAAWKDHKKECKQRDKC